MSNFETTKSMSRDCGESSAKPLVSYCLFTYKQERYIGESVDAALAQTYSPLEIIISDDCSPDSTYSIIEEKVKAYQGPHRVVINRNKENLGIGGHISLITGLAQGEFLVTVGGDDVSVVNHVELAYDTIQTHHGVFVADFDATIIDESGEELARRRILKESSTYCLDDFIKMKKKLSTFAPGRILHKDVINKFPPIASNCPTEDTVFVLRALILGKLRREPINVIQYRRTGNSVSSSSNIRSLSISGIINQYNTDIDHSLNCEMLGEVDTQSLRRRIAFEELKRRTKSETSTGGLLKLITRMKLSLYRTLYCLGFSFGS